MSSIVITSMVNAEVIPNNNCQDTPLTTVQQLEILEKTTAQEKKEREKSSALVQKVTANLGALNKELQDENALLKARIIQLEQAALQTSDAAKKVNEASNQRITALQANQDDLRMRNEALQRQNLEMQKQKIEEQKKNDIPFLGTASFSAFQLAARLKRAGL